MQLTSSEFNYSSSDSLVLLPSQIGKYILYYNDSYLTDINIIPYNNYYSNDTIIISNNYNINNDISLFDFTALWIIYSGLIVGIVFLFFIYVCIKKYKKDLYKFLANADLLYVDYSEEFLTTDDSENNIISLGLGYNTRSRTTILGGIFTILIILIGVFLISSYLYQTINNNSIKTVSLGLSGNNIIPIGNSFLEIQLTFYNILNGSCNNWIYDFTGLKGYINKDVYCNILDSDYISKNISLNYKCVGCVIDTGIDSYLYFRFSEYNSFYTGLQYKIITNSYFTDSILEGNIFINKDSLLYDDSSLISLSTTPSVYNEYDLKSSVGFVLDYNNIFIGKSKNIQNIKDKIINTIGLTIKISRNLSWMFITVSERFTGLIIFSQTFSIIGGIFAVSKFILNFVSRKMVRKFVYDFLNKSTKEKKITHKMKISEITRNSIKSLSEIKLHTIK